MKPIRLRSRRSWTAIVPLLGLWVLAASVYGDFNPVRIKLLRQPLPPRQSVSVPLPTSDISDPYLVFVYRARNTGTSRISIAARTEDELLRHSSIDPGSARRVDLAWPHPSTAAAGDAIDLAGTTDQWVLEYAELANLHGFTRGAMEFVVLPSAQRFTAPPAWAFGTWIAWALVIVLIRPAPWPRWPTTAYAVLSIVIVAFFAIVAIAPLVSPYRVVLAPHTFAGALVMLAVPHGVALLGRARPWVALAPAAVRWLRSMAAHGVARIPWRHAALVTTFAGYAVMLWWHVGAYAGGADSSGYMNAARLLADGHLSTPARALPGIPAGDVPLTVYMPLGFGPSGSDTLVPTYPIGLPAIIAALAPLTGWDSAADVTMVLHALAGVVLLATLARECGLSVSAAALAALLLGTSPLYLFMSVTLMSDTPALVWITAAVLMAFRSRQHASWALAAGVAASIAVLTRPTNVLLFAAVAVCLGLSMRRWLLLIAGGLPGAALLIAYNLAVYGAAVTTGYGDFNRFFGAEHIFPTLRHYAVWLPVLLTPIGLLALGLPVLLRRAPRLVTVLLVWILSFGGFFAYYAYTNDTWWYMRFLLPAFPAFIIGSLWVGSDLLERAGVALRQRMPRRGVLVMSARVMSARVGAVLLAAVILAHNAWWGTYLHVLSSGPGERTYLEVAEWSRANLPPEAGIVAMQASGALFYYTEFPILRWDLLETESWRRLEAEGTTGRQPLYAVLFPFDIELKAFDRLPGQWVQVGAIEDVTVWRFEGGS